MPAIVKVNADGSYEEQWFIEGKYRRKVTVSTDGCVEEDVWKGF